MNTIEELEKRITLLEEKNLNSQEDFLSLIQSLSEIIEITSIVHSSYSKFLTNSFLHFVRRREGDKVANDIERKIFEDAYFEVGEELKRKNIPITDEITKQINDLLKGANPH